LGLLLLGSVPVAASDYEQDGTEVFFFRAKEVDVPIIMYHLVTEKPKYIGKYGITPAELEKDLAYLAEASYTAVTMAEVINFVERGEKLPKKPIVLSFDDGNYSDYFYVLPLLEKYNAKGVFAIIGKVTDQYTDDLQNGKNSVFPNLTWAQIKAMHDSGLAEIASHGYDMHGKRGSGKKQSEDAAAYAARLKTDLDKLQQNCFLHLNAMPSTFVYPLGIVSKGSTEVLESLGFKASFGCEEGITTVRQGDKDCLFKMKRHIRPSGKSVEEILKG